MRNEGSVPETRGSVSIRVLWEIQKEAIIDVRFGDDDADTWNPEGMYKLLDRWEKPIRKKMGKIATIMGIFFIRL